MTEITASVIIVSRQRPMMLLQCLKSVSQLLYPHFEVIVVADAEGLAAASRLPFFERLHLVEYDEQNVSSARNKGLADATGEVVAFLDDDSVAEPGWLNHLVRPFRDPRIHAAGGFVRGRNGISYQWRGQMISGDGFSTDITLKDTAPVVVSGGPGQAVNVVGTNCAFLRKALATIGGFDPAFRYYLDEADVSMRLAKSGGRTAIVPLAEVHHSLARSERRQANRMPKSLFEVGASHAVFLRKHADPRIHSRSVTAFTEVQRKRLLKHMVAGHCEPLDVDWVLSTLRSGLAEGFNRALPTLPKLSGPTRAFRALRDADDCPDHEVVSGYRLGARRLRQKSKGLAGNGAIVSLYLFSRTALYHRVRFRDGVWEQSGGLFGRSDRSQALFKLTTMSQRLESETNRSALQRYPAE